ncbi:MAG: low molecular weight protein arginine phosphatase [Firmicutes bacterium]|nr:low molecular weight protein arginine phosphatase [Bacillota bacterium]
MSSKKKLLLFVCTGNTCRSPLAQVIAARLLEKEGLSDWTVASAGLAALNGMSASRQALTVANTLGLDLALHQSRSLTEELAAKAELILVMTQAHKEMLLKILPQYGEKVFTLKEFIGQTGDIADPFGGSVAVYMETAQELQDLLQLAVKKLANPNDKD